MNTNQSLYFDIFKSVLTSDDISRSIDAIDALLNDLYEVRHKPIVEQISSLFQPHLAQSVRTIMDAQHIDMQNIDACREFFTALEEQLKQVKAVQLTISVALDRELIASIIRYFRDAFSQQNAVLDIKINPQIVGGAEIVWNGKYWNFTLGKQIDEWFANTNQLTALHTL